MHDAYDFHFDFIKNLTIISILISIVSSLLNIYYVTSIFATRNKEQELYIQVLECNRHSIKNCNKIFQEYKKLLSNCGQNEVFSEFTKVSVVSLGSKNLEGLHALTENDKIDNKLILKQDTPESYTVLATIQEPIIKINNNIGKFESIWLQNNESLSFSENLKSNTDTSLFEKSPKITIKNEYVLSNYK